MKIRILPLIKPNYIYDVFSLIKSKNKSKDLDSFLEFFETNFLKTYDIDWWNYYNDTSIRSNNPCEGFNNRLRKVYYEWI